MAITVKHTKVSTVPDGDDTSVVRPSDWNADHQLVGTVPIANGGTGASTANDAFNALAPTQTGNNGKYLTTDGTNTSWGTNPLGTVTSVGTGTGLTGGPITTSGTISFSNSGVATWAQTPSSANLAAAITDETGSGSLVFANSPSLSSPTIDGANPYINMTPTTAPTYAEGRVFYDSSANTLCYYNDNSQVTVNIGQENLVRVRNQTGAALTNGTVVYINGATGNTPTVAKAISTSFSTSDIIGVLTTDIANNGFGYATTSGLVNGLDTSAFTEGQAVFVSPTTAGTFTATEPTAPNYSIQVGVILRANPSVGTLLVAIQVISTENIHIVGTITPSQGGTGQTTYTNGQLLIGNTTGNTLTKSTLTASTGISVTNGAGSITLANTAPDQTVVLTAGTGISTSGTYPNFTITNTAPSSGGTVTSVTATSPVASTGGTTPVISMPAATSTVNGYLTSADWTTFNSKQPAGTYVNSVSGTTGRITSTGGVTPVIDLTSGIATAGTTGSSALIPVVTIDTYGRVTSITTAANPQGTVTSVTGTAPVVSSGGATPAISMAAATGSVNGYLTSTDWTTFNSKQPAGTYVTAVSVASSNGFTGTSSGGATPAITLATSITGMLKGNGTAISAGTAGTDYVAPATATSFTAQQYFGNVALTDAATITWAANTAQVATFTFVSSNRTMGAPTGLVSGAYYGLAVIQNGGSNTLTWNSVFKWAGGTAPTLSTASGAKDYFVFRTDGTNMYEQGRSLGVA